MPRTCTICTHPERAVIDAAIVRGETGIRDIAGRFGISKSALDRHRKEHLPAHLLKAKDAAAVADADDLLRQAGALRSKAISLLMKAEAAGDLRAALAGVREARGCIELLARLLGEIRDGPIVNVTISPAWIEVRGAVVGALAPFPEARTAVAGALAKLEAGDAGDD